MYRAVPMIESDEVTIGSQLRRYREQAGWSRDLLADKAEVSAVTIERIENQRHDPTLGTAIKLAMALEVPVSLLIGLKEVRR